MSKMAGAYFLTGAIIASVGVGLSYGVGNGLFTLGVFLVFAAVFGEWE